MNPASTPSPRPPSCTDVGPQRAPWHERSSSAPAQDQDGRRIGEFEPASAPSLVKNHRYEPFIMVYIICIYTYNHMYIYIYTYNHIYIYNTAYPQLLHVQKIHIERTTAASICISQLPELGSMVNVSLASWMKKAKPETKPTVMGICYIYNICIYIYIIYIYILYVYIYDCVYIYVNTITYKWLTTVVIHQ